MVEVPIVFPLYVHLILVVFLVELSSGLDVVSATEMVTGALAVTSEFFTSSVGVGLGLGGRVVLLVVVKTVKGVVDLVGGELVTVCCCMGGFLGGFLLLLPKNRKFLFWTLLLDLKFSSGFLLTLLLLLLLLLLEGMPAT